jgi:hygromycin-B 7''-O-kinase
MTGLEPLAFETDAVYAARLRDVGFWTPYVQLALERSGLPAAREVVLPEVGTYPTFLVDDGLVVKLFGARYAGPESYRAESAAYAELRGSGLPIPALVHEAELFPSDESCAWPFLVMTRVPGMAYAAAGLTLEQRLRCAGDIGAFLAKLHAREVHFPERWDDYEAFVQNRRANVVADHRKWAHLPAHLVAQIEAWLPDVDELLKYEGTAARRALVHGDLHDHHIFVEPETGRLSGVIDFTDSLVGDRRYDLVALHAGTFHYDRRLLKACLASYGWVQGGRFAPEMLAFTLLHEFDMFAERADLPAALDGIGDLDELARVLWEASA